MLLTAFWSASAEYGAVVALDSPGLLVRGTGLLVFFEFVFTDALNYGKAPSSHRGPREMAMSAPPRCFLWRLTSDTFILLLVQRQSIELPARTKGE